MQAYPWGDFVLGVVILALAPLALGAYGGHMAADAYDDPFKKRRAKIICWGIALLGVLCAGEFQRRSISSDRKHDEQYDKLLSAIQEGGRTGQFDIPQLIQAWGTASVQEKPRPVPKSPAPKPGTTVPVSRPPVNPEALGRALGGSGIANATIISDGSNEPANFAKSLEIGLRMSGWQVGGDNIKMGDPGFFPDPLTIEVSADPASAEDRSKDEAKALIAALRNQGIKGVLRFADLKFPPNFMRIKVAGQ